MSILHAVNLLPSSGQSIFVASMSPNISINSHKYFLRAVTDTSSEKYKFSQHSSLIMLVYMYSPIAYLKFNGTGSMCDRGKL
jgi:hypothetical protein